MEPQGQHGQMEPPEQQEEFEFHRGPLQALMFGLWHLATVCFFLSIVVFSYLGQLNTVNAIMFTTIPVLVLAGVERFVESVAFNPLKKRRLYYVFGQLAWIVALVGSVDAIYNAHSFLTFMWCAIAALGWFLIGLRNINDHKMFTARIKDEPHSDYETPRPFNEL